MEQAELVHGVNPSVRVLSQPYLEDFYTWLGRAGGGRHQKTRSRATCIKLLQALQLAWAWAAKSGRWPDIPLPRPLEKKKPPRRTVVAPSYEEWDSMMASLRVSCERYQGRVPEGVARDWPYRLAMLCRFTGMRRLAGLQLTGAHIDLNRGAINIPGELTKGGYGGRIIPLHDDLAKAVEKWDVGPGSLVMPPALELTGRGHVDRTFRRAWMRASVGRDRWAGQPIHSARKMIRTHLVIEGYQPDVIDTLLAHAPPGTGGRSYLDQLRLWEPLVEAVGKIPSLRENL
jgi:integrase